MIFLKDWALFHPFFFWASAGLFFLCIGSFLNVVILRLPLYLKKNWAVQSHLYLDLPYPQASDLADNILIDLYRHKRSRCPSCDGLIAAYDNIPILSYCLLKGRCRRCSAPISARYPLIETWTCVSSLILVYQYLPLLSFSSLFFVLLFNAFLILLTCIDWDHQLLPDELTQPLLWLCLLWPLWDPQLSPSLSDRLLGAVCGYMILFFVAGLFKLFAKKEGMGQGDFKFLAVLGAFFGLDALPSLLLISSVVGTISGLVLILSGRHQFGQAIPFGPYLALSAWYMLFFGCFPC